jgi:hypothetical protein
VIIPIFCFKTFSEYIERSKGIEVPRPETCSNCNGKNSYWRHGFYTRKVSEEGSTADIEIQRFICRYCAVVVSCLFSFLIPYRRFSAAVVGKAVEDYATKPTTYRHEACELSELNSSDSPKPSHSQVFKWVGLMVEKADSLLFLVQKEKALKGQWQLMEETECYCPNSDKARIEGKANMLNRLAVLVSFAISLVGNESEVLTKLHTYFLQGVESLQGIFSNFHFWLSTTQSMKHGIF